MREKNLFHERGDVERDDEDDEGCGADWERRLFVSGERGVGGSGFINLVAGSIVLKFSKFTDVVDALLKRAVRSMGT